MQKGQTQKKTKKKTMSMLFKHFLLPYHLWWKKIVNGLTLNSM